MKDLLDVHMHTLASGHAYNTIREMIAAGSKKGLALVGIADHAPAMPGSTHRFYFENLRIFDRKAYGKEAGVELLMGVELNILNTTGKVDLEEKALRSVDYAIASLHDPCINPGTELDNTTAVMSAMWVPQVKIIGHPDNPRFPVDFDKIAKAAKEQGFDQLARLWEATSAAEQIHINLEASLVEAEDPSYTRPTAEAPAPEAIDLNLIASANGEIFETSDMYPGFIAKAQEEGNDKAVQVFTKAKLAEAVHVTPQAVSKWELGQALPDIALLPDLSSVLGVRIDELFESPEETHLRRIEAMIEREPMLSREGHRGGTWVLMDFGSLVVHVFTAEARKFYDLERLWQDGHQVNLAAVLGENA